MENTKENFLITVNLAMFKVEEGSPINAKRLPQKELMVLLEKRTRAPFKGCWMFPYSFVDQVESLDDAIYRELKQKTNIENIYLEQLYTWGAVDRDPTARVLATSYLAIIPKEQLKTEGFAEKNNLKWFSVKKILQETKKISELEVTAKYKVSLKEATAQIHITYYVIEHTTVTNFEKRTRYSYEPYENSSAQMAYDHIKILDYALDRIKNKVSYTTIAFGFVPTFFTLTELQQVYELLLGKKLINSNFRQLIQKKVEKTPHMKKEGAFRPSQLYRLKKSTLIDSLEEVPIQQTENH